MPGKNAPAIATELFSAPALASRLRRAPPLEDVLVLIKAAAGDDEATACFPAAIASDPKRAGEIAAFYLQQIHLRPDATDHQVLCLAPFAGPEKVKEHKRWLLKWLHPDRNNNRWEQAYFERISAAATRLEQALANPSAVAQHSFHERSVSGRGRKYVTRHHQRQATTLRGHNHRRRHIKLGGKASALLALLVLALIAVFGHQMAALFQSYFGGTVAENLAMGPGN